LAKGSTEAYYTVQPKWVLIGSLGSMSVSQGGSLTMIQIINTSSVITPVVRTRKRIEEVEEESVGKVESIWAHFCTNKHHADKSAVMPPNTDKRHNSLND